MLRTNETLSVVHGMLSSGMDYTELLDHRG